MDEEISLELRIDPARGIPIYRQIVDGVRYAISSGRLIPGDRLPSVQPKRIILALPYRCRACPTRSRPA